MEQIGKISLNGQMAQTKTLFKGAHDANRGKLLKGAHYTTKGKLAKAELKKEKLIRE